MIFYLFVKISIFNRKKLFLIVQMELVIYQLKIYKSELNNILILN